MPQYNYPADFNNTFWTVIDADYYVSSNGNDVSGDGSPKNPFLTVEKAMEVATDGEKIIVGPNQYATYSSDQSASGALDLCRVATIGNVDLGAGGVVPHDGITLEPGDRVLVWQQTDAKENGIYTVAAGSWKRASDFDAVADIKGGRLIPITEGTNGGKTFRHSNSGDITIGSTDITFEEAFVTPGDFTLALTDKADKTNVLELTNATIFSPSADYHPATKKYVDDELGNLTATLDKATPKGLIDCSPNPNYPAGDLGDYYYVSVEGKIGGASGPTAELGDKIQCIADNGGGTHASVGGSWIIFQGNLDKATASDVIAGVDDSKYVTPLGVKAAVDNITETDPVFTASPSAGITSGNITDWNSAFGWGNHASAGYLTSETDPVFTGSPAGGITSGNISNWNNAHGWGDHALGGYLTTETDPVFTASPAGGITSGNITNWNTAYGWGDHGVAGYQAGISGLSISGSSIAADDKVLIQDTSNGNNLRQVTAQSIADLNPGTNLNPHNGAVDFQYSGNTMFEINSALYVVWRAHAWFQDNDHVMFGLGGGTGLASDFTMGYDSSNNDWFLDSRQSNASDFQFRVLGVDTWSLDSGTKELKFNNGSTLVVPPSPSSTAAGALRFNSGNLEVYNSGWQSVAGNTGLSNIVEDTSPQLGGNLDAQSNSISGVSQLNVDNLRIDGNAISSQNTNGDVEVDINGNGIFKVNSSINSYYGTDLGVSLGSKGNIFLNELSSAPPDISGYGQIWVKSDSPNTLWFTDDAGNDHQLGVSSGGGGDVSKVGTPVNDQVAVWTGDGTIEGNSNFLWTGSALRVLNAGSASAPSIQLNDDNTGVYGGSSGIAFSVQGLENLRIGSFYLEIPDKIRHAGDADTYIQFHNPNQFRVVTGNAEQLEIGSSYLQIPSMIRHAGDTDTYIQFHASNQFRVVTGGVEQLEIGSSYLQIPGMIRHTGDTDTYMEFNGANSWRVVTGGSQRLLVNSTGITVTGTGTASDWIATSDERLKENWKVFGDVLDKVKGLRGSFSHFNWIDGDKTDVGYSAQKIGEFFPEIVSENSDGFKGLSYNKLSGIALEAIAEESERSIEREMALTLRIERLEKEIETLKNQN